MALPLPILRAKISLPFLLLATFLAILWIAGGASRAGLWGQIITRGAAWLLLIIAFIWADRPKSGSARPVTLFLSATIALALLQLVPLPPIVWTNLPGRAVFIEAAAVGEQSQPWRPLAIVPGGAINALSSLVVPITTLCLASCMRETEHRRLLDWILILIVASMIWGMLQFAGLDIEDPFINQTPGAVSACFANRNHFALFLALGCLLAPVWAGRDGIHARGRALIALALILLFVLTILATGSRAGLMLAALALCTDFWLVGAELRAALQRRPRWFACLLALLSGGALAGLVTLSFFLDRAESINRVLQNNAEQDMRAQALPTVMQMIRSYFPSGSGFGSFDPLFRMHEPFSLLNLSYFNHAHNDFLEITLEGGLPAIILLIAGIGWWIFATVGLPKAGTCRSALARLGSGMLLLTLAASTFDYPARTPTIMALVTLAAFWLAREGRRALPVIPPDL